MWWYLDHQCGRWQISLLWIWQWDILLIVFSVPGKLLENIFECKLLEVTVIMKVKLFIMFHVTFAFLLVVAGDHDSFEIQLLAGISNENEMIISEALIDLTIPYALQKQLITQTYTLESTSYLSRFNCRFRFQLLFVMVSMLNYS